MEDDLEEEDKDDEDLARLRDGRPESVGFGDLERCLPTQNTRNGIL